MSRLKGYFAFSAAPCTGGFEHLSGFAGTTRAGLFPAGPAIRAALGLVLKSFRLIELLLAYGEDEGFAALGTGKGLFR